MEPIKIRFSATPMWSVK